MSYPLCHNVTKKYMKTTELDTTGNYSEPAPELIDDIRKRLAEVPQDVIQRAHYALTHAPLQEGASILYKPAFVFVRANSTNTARRSSHQMPCWIL